jgi:hypothetical protein
MRWPFCKRPRDSIDQADRWFVEVDKQAVAVIANPAPSDMFWFTWDILPLDGTATPEDLWDYALDARRSFRHAATGERDCLAFPAGKGILPDGRVLLRGPHRKVT